MRNQRRVALAGSVAISAMLLAGCDAYGSKSNTASKDKADSQQSQAPAPAPSPPATGQPTAPPVNPSPGQQQAPPPGKGLRPVQNAQLGTILVAGKGRTIYRFDNDKARPSKSNCEGACLKAWPPVKRSWKLKMKGVDRSRIGNYMRPNGFCQLTIDGWPMYYYSKDTAPGDAKGHGVDGKWFATAPDGSKAGTQPGNNQNQYPGNNNQSQYPGGNNATY